MRAVNKSGVDPDEEVNLESYEVFLQNYSNGIIIDIISCVIIKLEHLYKFMKQWVHHFTALFVLLRIEKQLPTA